MADGIATPKAVNNERSVFFVPRGLCPALRPRRAPPACCLHPDTPPLRPDPAIYSQEQLFAAGQPATWDSPDITTNVTGGIDQNVVVVVRNLSAQSGAAGVNVRLDYSDFGIGMPRSTLGSQSVDLARAGSKGNTAQLSFYVSSSLRSSESSIAVFVELQHPTDITVANNRGEQAWSASSHAAGADAIFSFPIRNRLAGTQAFQLSVLESDWSSRLNAGSVTLLPNQSQTVTLTVTIPASFAGSKAFNVVALAADGNLYGGIFHRFDI